MITSWVKLMMEPSSIDELIIKQGEINRKCKMNKATEDYIKGFKDGAKSRLDIETEMIFMGYTLDQLGEIIYQYEMNKVEPMKTYEPSKADKAPVNKAPMNKEEAIKKTIAIAEAVGVSQYLNTNNVVFLLETLKMLGVIDLVEPEKTEEQPRASSIHANLLYSAATDQGFVRLEMWPEGLVLWVDGKIVYQSEKRKYIFFPHPDGNKDNVSVYQDDAVKTLKQYGYSIYDKNDNKL